MAEATTATIRTPAQRRIDTQATLERGGDAWIASAGADGRPHLIALSYYWDGTTVTMATTAASRTARNLTQSGWVRIALVLTDDVVDDVVILEGPVAVIPLAAAGVIAGEHAERTGFDVWRESEPCVFLRLRPTRVQAMRNPAEQADQTIMRDGIWLDAPARGAEHENGKEGRR